MGSCCPPQPKSGAAAPAAAATNEATTVRIEERKKNKQQRFSLSLQPPPPIVVPDFAPLSFSKLTQKRRHANDEKQKQVILSNVREYYGKVLSTSKDLKTSACTAAGAPPPALRAVLRKVPSPVTEKFYGCGAPLPMGIQGLRVLDLGSGSGRDCYAAAALVGEGGNVVGVDMTDEQLAVAREHADAYCTQTLGYSKPNMSFVKGYMEDLKAAGISDNSFDLVISNCVVNLSPDKGAVLREAFRVLGPGGEFYFSDVYADRRVPEAAQKDEVLWGECVSGALYVEDFKREARAAGFTYPVHVSAAPIEVNDAAMRKLLGPARFYSITFRLFKLPEGLLESCCEDYGQRAVYKGTIEGSEGSYGLDAGHVFEAGRPTPVCGNTAAMLGEGGHSWLSRHFDVEGDRRVHFGLWGCGVGGRHPVGLTTVDKGGESSGGGCC